MSDNEKKPTENSSQENKSTAPSTPSLPQIPGLDKVKELLPKNIKLDVDFNAIGQSVLDKSKKSLDEVLADPSAVLKKINFEKIDDAVMTFNSKYLKPKYDP